MSLTVNQLKAYANKWLNQHYGFGLDVPLKINGRLKKAYGVFRYKKYSNGTKEPLSVEVNKSFVENNDDTVVLDVLKHELVHYALFRQGKPNSDGHPIFENELARLNVINQRDINKKYQIAIKKHFYKCVDCEHEYRTKTALRNGCQNYRCTCGGELSDLGKRIAI